MTWKLNSYGRRDFLLSAGLLTGLTIASKSQPVLANPRFSGYPFTLGVASGDPLPDSVVICCSNLAESP